MYSNHPPGAPPGPGQWVPQQQYQPAPPPRKKSNALLFVIVGLTLGFGSCGTFCGYHLYKAQTPEGKKEAKEREEKMAAQVDGFVVKLAKIRAAIPAEGSATMQCPKGTNTAGAPIVDSYYLEMISGGGADDRAQASKLLRDKLFPESVAEESAKKALDGGLSSYHSGSFAYDIEALDKKPYVIVLRLDDVIMPEPSGSSFTGGELSGSAVVVDWKTATVACHAPISASSSEDISYGGGVRIKVKGIPMPAVGKTDLDDALSKDFKKNVEASVRAALKEIGGA